MAKTTVRFRNHNFPIKTTYDGVLCNIYDIDFITDVKRPKFKTVKGYYLEFDNKNSREVLYVDRNDPKLVITLVT